ncbi:MAG: hypothetical protein WED05_01005 [Candidatus Atabeyarchaeum deiterrae]
MSEAPDWNRITSGFACKTEVFPIDDLGAQCIFAITYHSVTSIRSRCYENVGTVTGDRSSFVGEAIISSKTASDRQLLVKLFTTSSGGIELMVCSDEPEEPQHQLAEYKERIKTLTEKVKKMDETEKGRLFEIIKVEMKLDKAIDSILSKTLVGIIYPTIGIIRETLIRTLEGFDPIHIETCEVMEMLHTHPQGIPLDNDRSRVVAVKALDWRRRISRIVDGTPHLAN